MEDDLNVTITFSRIRKGESWELEIRLDYNDISRVITQGQEYISMVDGPRLLGLIVESKIKEFDEIIQKLNLWYIFNRFVNNAKTFRCISWDMDTSQLDKEDEIKRFFTLFLKNMFGSPNKI